MTWDPAEIRETVRTMLADWDAATPEQRAQAIQAANEQLKPLYLKIGIKETS